MYDNNNIFAKIVRGEIPCNKICENDYALSFYDINPLFKTHVLVIPKGPYQNILDFVRNASADEQSGFWACFSDTAAALNIDNNFNVMANAGADATFIAQSVFHFHLHLVAGDATPELARAIQCQHA